MVTETPKQRFDTLRLIANEEGFAFYCGGTKLSILACDLAIRPNQPPLMQIALPAGQVDAIGRPMFALVDPQSGRARVVRRIEWADGASIDFPLPAVAETVVQPPSETVVRPGNGGAERVVRDVSDEPPAAA